MAVAYDTAVNSQLGSVSTGQDILTIGANANRVLVVLIGLVDAGAVTVTSVTGCGATWSLVGSGAGNGTYRGVIWKGLTPNSGSQTITVNLSGTVSGNLIITGYSFYNASDVSGAVFTLSGNNVITVETNGMAGGAHYDNNTNRTVSGCTTTLDVSGFTISGFAGAHCTGTPTSTFTWSGFDANSVAMGAAVAPLAATVPTIAPSHTRFPKRLLRPAPANFEMRK